MAGFLVFPTTMPIPDADHLKTACVCGLPAGESSSLSDSTASASDCGPAPENLSPIATALIGAAGECELGRNIEAQRIRTAKHRNRLLIPGRIDNRESVYCIRDVAGKAYPQIPRYCCSRHENSIAAKWRQEPAGGACSASPFPIAVECRLRSTRLGPLSGMPPCL